MTAYKGQTTEGKVKPMSSEHPDTNLLFSELDRRYAYHFINNAEQQIGMISLSEMLERLHSIDDANDSVQARYFIDKLASVTGGLSE